MKKIIVLLALIGLSHSPFCQVLVENIRLTSEPKQIPINFKIGKVSCSTVIRDTITNHKGWQWPIEDGLIGAITAHINEQYESTSHETFRMNINEYNFIVNGYKKWRSWLDVSFYDQNRNEIFRVLSWEDLESMPKKERGAAVIKTLLHECLSLYNSYLRKRQNYLNTDSLRAGFYMDQKGFLDNQPYFNDEVTIMDLENGKEGTGMYSIKFANDSTYEKSLGGLVFGYSDGTDNYISTRNYQNTTAFSKVITQGKDWAIFYHDKVPSDPGLVAGSIAAGVILGALTGIAVVPYFNNYEGYVVIDFASNEVQPATLQMLKTKINQNPSLKKEAKLVSNKELKANLLDWWEKTMESR
ncbi:hypothetical protein [Ekhidna sp.]|uniref:hypothetical protein n=1 Tax=Ekhidna sp. TaxID=2608089 RepID=UPI0032982E7F